MSARVKHDVKTTVNKTSIYTATIALNGITGTLVNSTDMGSDVEGTNGGYVTVTLPEGNRYRQILHWEIVPQVNAAYAGTFTLHKVSGSAVDGTFQFRVLSGTAPGTTLGLTGTPVNTVDGAVGLTGSLFAVLRDTDRTV